VTGKLILANGEVFEGVLVDDSLKAVGEVVFNTGMTGYQEILTDPSYADQIITLTYPLVGNYGVNDDSKQSRFPSAKGMVIGELCDYPSNWQNKGSFRSFLKENNIPCLYNVDTRAVTRAIRNEGVMKGIIVSTDTSEAEIQALLREELPTDQIKRVTTKEIVKRGPIQTEYQVAVFDYGVKESILRAMESAGMRLTVYPADTKAEMILKTNPDGIFLSNGPGDPQSASYAVDEIKKLIGKKPIFGICMGHQLLALAFGGATYKLRFGHRGSNHPVKDLRTNRVYITSQNHGYAVEDSSLEGKDLIITHRSVNDNTVEGMKHSTLPVMSVQYHPEASPGPTDNLYLFDEFKTMMKDFKK